MIVLAPAFAIFEADGAADAVGDRLVGEKDLFLSDSFNSLPLYPCGKISEVLL